MVMAAAMKQAQADLEISSCDDCPVDTSLDAMLKECTEILVQKDAEFLNCSVDLRQIMKHHSTQCMGAEAYRYGLRCILISRSKIL